LEAHDDRSETDAGREPSRPPWSLASLGLVGATLGAMLGASALGVINAEALRRAQDAGRNARSSEAQRARRWTTSAVGVWREIRASDESQTATEWLAMAMARLDADPSASATRASGARARRTASAARPSAGVTSDNVPAGPAQGFVDGRPTRITVTRMDGKPVEVHTAIAFERMRTAAQRDGVALRINSGFRTMEHQHALYAAFRQGRGNLAARPGESNHQSGHALDLNTATPGVFPWLQRNARRFGFRRTVPSEPWHWEYW